MATNVSIGLSGQLPGVWQFPIIGDGLSQLQNSDIPPNAETEYDFFAPVSTPGLALILFTATINCTIFINGSGTGTSAQAEITLTAGVPFIWYAEIGFNVNEVVGDFDITKIWIRNNSPGAMDGTLNARCQYVAQGN